MRFSAGIKILFSAFIISAAVEALPAPDNNGSMEIGKVLFKNESAAEVMVLSSVETPSLYIANGSILNIGKRGSELKVTVTDICGLYIRCRVISSNSRLLPDMKVGDIVYLSASGNASVKFSDVKILLSSLIKLYEDFIFRIESVDDPAVISAYIDSFSADLEKLLPEMERLNRRYPELLKFYSEPPAELKFESETLKLLEPALGNAFFKIKIYAEDPAVKKSLDKLQKVLERMRSSRK